MTDAKPPCTHGTRKTQRCYTCNPLTKEPTMTEKDTKMTHGQARAALQAYMGREVEICSIAILEAYIQRMAENPGVCIAEHRTRDSGFAKQLTIDRIQSMNLKTPGVPWLDRFQKLVEEIREEFDLHEGGEDDHPSDNPRE